MIEEQEIVRKKVLNELVALIEGADAADKTTAEAIYDAGFRKFEIVEDETPGKLDRIRVLAFDPSALIYSDAPGYIQDIRDVLDGEVTNT